MPRGVREPRLACGGGARCYKGSVGGLTDPVGELSELVVGVTRKVRFGGLERREVVPLCVDVGEARPVARRVVAQAAWRWLGTTGHLPVGGDWDMVVLVAGCKWEV